MQDSVWIRLVQRLPVEIHDQLLIQMVNGVRIKLLKIFRLEDEFLVCLGRLAGANDDGQVMLLPYEHFSNVSIDRKMSIKQVDDLFDGEAGARRFSAATIEEESELAAPEPEVEVEEPQDSSPSKPKPPSKSLLLKRLRERLAQHESDG